MSHSKNKPAIEGFFAGLSKFHTEYVMGEESPFLFFNDFEEIWNVLTRLGVVGDVQKLLRIAKQNPGPPDKELQIVQEFTTGGTFQGCNLTFCVLLAIFINQPDSVDGLLLVAVPARGAESMAKAKIHDFYLNMWKTLSADSNFGFEVKRDAAALC
jgi:hypothetical protein